MFKIIIRHKVLASTIFILITFIIINILPIKFAMKEEIIDNNKSYIIVETEYSSVSNYIIISGNGVEYNIGENVIISGKYPKLHYSIMQFAKNRFILYGHFDGYEKTPGNYVVKKFYANNWDILYPVKRGSLIRLPKSYLCIYDKWGP